MKRSALVLGAALALACGSAVAKDAKYGPSNHFLIKKTDCSMVNPTTQNVGSREEAQKLDQQYRLCTEIAEQSQSTERSELYAQIEAALGICQYRADVRSVSDYQVREKILPLRKMSEWTLKDVATVGVYEIDCGKNVNDQNAGNPMDGMVTVTGIVSSLQSYMIGAIGSAKRGQEQLDQAFDEMKARDKARQERDQALAAEGYTRMTLPKIKLDGRDHLGEKVVTNAFMYIVRNDSGLLAANEQDTNFLGVDISNASREFRQQALSRCSKGFKLCRIEVKGKLDKVGELIVIRAD